MARKRHQKPAPPKLSDTNWQARSDAHMLRDHAAMKADKKRFEAAKEHARHEADMFRKAAGRKS